MKCFHHDDHDGLSSAHVVMVSTGNTNPDNYIAVNYEDDVPDKFDKVVDGEEVWIVDYSISEKTKDMLDKLMKKTDNIIWCDHHDTSIKLIKKFPEYNDIAGIRDKKWSGAVLTFMHCFPDKKIPKYLTYISDFDTWTHKYPESTLCMYGITGQNDVIKTCEKLYSEYENDNNSDDVLSTKLDGSESGDGKFLTELISNGSIIQQYVTAVNKLNLDELGYECMFEGYKILVINNNSNSIIFGDRIKDYPMVAIYSHNGIEYIYSLYSDKKDINCAEIAEKHGGGGHPGAAGFRSKKLEFKRD